jgi:GxxExxY protein
MSWFGGILTAKAYKGHAKRWFFFAFAVKILLSCFFPYFMKRSPPGGTSSERFLTAKAKMAKMVTQEQEKTAKKVLDCAYEVHSLLGPGLLESAYQICLRYELQQRGVFVDCEKLLPVLYKEITVDCGYRIDMVVEYTQVIVENKSVKALEAIHLSQILTYMRLSGITLGFLFNFNVRHFKDGVRRIVLNR